MFNSHSRNVLLVALALCVSPALHAEDLAATHSGNWWDPADGGWGVATLDQGNILGPYWFTYDDEGRPTWLMGIGLPQPDGSYAGDLYRFTGTPFQRIDQPSITAETLVGTVTLSFDEDPYSMRFTTTIDGQSVSRDLTRFDFAGKDVVCKGVAAARADMTNYTDMWWEPATTGWGINVIHLDEHIYGQWYTYESPDQPVFMTLGLERQADGSYRGPVYRQNDGGRPFKSASTIASEPGAEEVGTASLIFLDGTRAEFDYVMGEDEGHHVLQRFQFGDLANQCETRPYQGTGGGDDDGDGGAGELCLPEHAINDSRTVRSRSSSDGSAAEVFEFTEVITGPASFNGQTGFKQVSYSAQYAGDGAYANSYLGNGAGTVASFGAEAMDPDTKQIISTSKNDPARVELNRRFVQGETIALDYDVNSTSAAGHTRTEMKTTYRLVAKESVTVDAGTFEACKIEHTIDLRSETAGVKLHTQRNGFMWTHPTFGKVKETSEGTSTVNAHGYTSTTTHSDQQALIRATMGGQQRP